jgi:hypothetical protein
MSADTEKCLTCGKVVERKEVIKQDDSYEIVLSCGHSYKRVRVELMDSVPISESIKTNIISFDSKEDRTRGIGALTRSKVVSNSIEGDRFIVKREHLELFKNQGIKFTLIE